VYVMHMIYGIQRTFIMCQTVAVTGQDCAVNLHSSADLT